MEISAILGDLMMRDLLLCVGVATLTFVLGCGRPAGLAEIEALLAEHRVVQMAPGDAIRTGVPKIIQVNRSWSDSPQIRDKNGDGNPSYSFVSQVHMSVESVGDWQTVTETIRHSLESSEVSAEQLFRHRDDRVRFAAYYMLGQNSPISEHLPNSSSQIAAELARIASGQDLYEVAQAIDLLQNFDVYHGDAFAGAIHHPCSQIRLAALFYLACAELTDDKKKDAMPHLVTCLGDRDTVVREAAYGEVRQVLRDWQQVAESGGELPDGVAAMIETAPQGLRGPSWYSAVSGPITTSLAENQVKWNEWLVSHGLTVASRR